MSYFSFWILSTSKRMGRRPETKKSWKDHSSSLERGKERKGVLGLSEGGVWSPTNWRVCLCLISVIQFLIVPLCQSFISLLFPFSFFSNNLLISLLHPALKSALTHYCKILLLKVLLLFWNILTIKCYSLN